MAPGFGRGSPHTKHRSESPLAGANRRYRVQLAVETDAGGPHGGGHIQGTFWEIPTEHFGNSLQSTLRYRLWSTLKICAPKKRSRQSFFRPNFACVFWFVSRKMPWIEELCLELRSRQELSDVKRESSSNSVSCC